MHELSVSEDYLCVFCVSALHHTQFEKSEESTILDKLFWGRIDLNSTYALLYFEKDQASQKILHTIKYEAKPHLAIMMGKLIGSKLVNLSSFLNIEALVPVPIHPKKKFQRGYNQSEKLAEGISSVTNIPIDCGFVSKNRNTMSQTKAGRVGRWENVMYNFVPTEGKDDYKHIAIVDDVITTGATIEAMVRSIRRSHPQIAISVISLAVTL
jgi:ComF family protein